MEEAWEFAAVMADLLKELFAALIALFPAILGAAIVLSTYLARGIIEKGILSSDEKSDRQTLEDLQEIRKKLEHEKNKEIAEKLKEQEAKLRRELLEFDHDELRDETGKLSIDWREAILLSRSRLLKESERLKARSVSNLTLGITISILAVFVLIYLIFVLDDSKALGNWFEFLSLYGPRLTLVLIMQILASFFLRMYVTNEKDIRRNKNEITNLELRLTAGMLVDSSKAQKAKLAEKLMSEERNFVLDKKEKTASLNSTKETSEVLNSIQGLIKLLKP